MSDRVVLFANTLTRYLSEGDVDVMAILHYGENKQWDSAAGTTATLSKFQSILEEAYSSTDVGIDENCVVMRFAEFRLDVVPAFKFKEGHYSIPDTGEGKWRKTNPVAFAERITAVNKIMDGDFVPLIKMVKGWNRNEGWPIKSFHLECMMYGRDKSYTKLIYLRLYVEGILRRPSGYLDNAWRRPCHRRAS